jgi:hypothetical protein
LGFIVRTRAVRSSVPHSPEESLDRVVLACASERVSSRVTVRVVDDERVRAGERCARLAVR